MIKLKRLIVSTLLLIAAFGFLALITEMPLSIASALPPVICDEGEDQWCWESAPYWYCLGMVGQKRCINPVE